MKHKSILRRDGSIISIFSKGNFVFDFTLNNYRYTTHGIRNTKNLLKTILKG